MFSDERFDGARLRFTDPQAQYLAENIIGRVATCSSSGQPHVVPVLYRFDGSSIIFGRMHLQRTLKFRNMMANERVAFVVDDFASTKPMKGRGVEVRGTAEPVVGGDGVTMVRIIPLNIRSWGLED